MKKRREDIVENCQIKPTDCVIPKTTKEGIGCWKLMIK